MNNRGGSFFAGFLWGIIIGAALVFFLGTKKGKRLLKIISEEGLELSEILGADDLEDIIEEDEYVAPKKKTKNSVQTKESIRQAQDELVEEPSEITEESQVKSNGSSIKKIASSGRRFFRGIKRK